MKAIFLCQNAASLRNVYHPTVVSRLQGTVELDPVCYVKANVLANPDCFTDVQVIFSTWGMPDFTEEEIRTYLPALRCVFYAAGSVQAFAKPFLHCGVRVFSAWAANAVPVAEYTVAQILLAGKDFYCQTRLLGQRRFEDAARRRGSHFGNYRKRVGLIGCGMIGSMVAEMLKTYDLEVLAYDPFMSPEKAARLGVRQVGLDELFCTCSVVSNHLANNPQTQKMLGYAHFASMLPYATFLNTGRGAQVDEAGLVKALSERADLVAVLDVTDPEPSPADHPFYALENCFLTPHVAGSMGGEVVRMAEYMVDELARYVGGEPAKYEVTERMLETMA